MDINVEITSNDFTAFNKYYYLKKGLKPRLIIYLIVIIVLPVVINLGEPFDILGFVITMLFTAMIFGLLYFGLGYLSLNLVGKLPSSNGAILGKRKFIISDTGLIEESDSNTNIQKWNSIKSIEQNNEFIFVFIDKIAAYIIPKRYFNNIEHVNLFVENMKTRISGPVQSDINLSK